MRLKIVDESLVVFSNMLRGNCVVRAVRLEHLTTVNTDRIIATVEDWKLNTFVIDVDHLGL